MGVNLSAINNVNQDLPQDLQIIIRQIKFLNNMVEQDHRFIKKRTKPMLGFKSFHCATITIAGIENIRMIQKRQIIGANDNATAFDNFRMLMVS